MEPTLANAQFSYLKYKAARLTRNVGITMKKIVLVSLITSQLLTLPSLGDFITGFSETTPYGTGPEGIEVGGFSIGWSASNVAFGWFQSRAIDYGYFSRTEVLFANFADSSVWYRNDDTYYGFNNVENIGSATNHSFSYIENVTFADSYSPYYRGIILAKQDDRYIAIKPLDIYEVYVDSQSRWSKSLKYQYWYSDSGDTDFSTIPEPSTFTLVSVLGCVIWGIRKKLFI